jgi:hypothetical protein
VKIAYWAGKQSHNSRRLVDQNGSWFRILGSYFFGQGPDGRPYRRSDPEKLRTTSKQNRRVRKFARSCDTHKAD